MRPQCPVILNLLRHGEAGIDVSCISLRLVHLKSGLLQDQTICRHRFEGRHRYARTYVHVHIYCSIARPHGQYGVGSDTVVHCGLRCARSGCCGFRRLTSSTHELSDTILDCDEHEDILANAPDGIFPRSRLLSAGGIACCSIVRHPDVLLTQLLLFKQMTMRARLHGSCLDECSSIFIAISFPSSGFVQRLF